MLTEHLAFVRCYAAEQVALGRMTGPYSQSCIEEILGSSFISSPLAVVPKASSAGYRLVQNCSYRGPDGLSINYSIETAHFPTRWGSAAVIAQLVSSARCPVLVFSC